MKICFNFWAYPSSQKVVNFVLLFAYPFSQRPVYARKHNFNLEKGNPSAPNAKYSLQSILEMFPTRPTVAPPEPVLHDRQFLIHLLAVKVFISHPISVLAMASLLITKLTLQHHLPSHSHRIVSPQAPEDDD
jgi:hypothetical protein